MRRAGPVTVSVPAGAATDAAGNASAASTSTDARVLSARRLELATPGGQITIAVSDGAELLTFSTETPSPRPPAGARFPYGALSFSAEADPGSLVTFTITLPRPAASYYKLAGGAWSVFDVRGDTGATVSGNAVTVAIRDNGRGDADPRPGFVADPGAPAEVEASGPLPSTGSDPFVPAFLGLVLLVVGTLATRLRRRPVG
jgi:LPXTG-motif cell wall-anchored protein